MKKSLEKKVLSVLVALMIMMLTACGKSESKGTSDNGGTGATETVKQSENTATPAENKQEATPEPTAEPTKEATPEPTEVPAPEPTKEPEPDFEDEFDEFYSEGHEYSGVWGGDNGWIMTMTAEGAADIICVYTEYDGSENRKTYFEFWTNFIDDAFTCSHGRIVHSGDAEDEQIEEETSFEVHGDTLYWVNKNVLFTKLSDEWTDNPFRDGYTISTYDNDDAADDDEWVMETFGINFHYEDEITFDDIAGTSFYGYYLEDDRNEGTFFPYTDDVISWDTMDEFNCAFLDLGSSSESGQFCFIVDAGMNADINWTIEDDGGIKFTYLYTGEDYYGDFWSNPFDGKLYVRIFVGSEKLWLVQGDKITYWENW